MAADWGAPWDYVNRLMNSFGSPNSIGNGSVCHVGREFAHTITYGAMTVPLLQKAKQPLQVGKTQLLFSAPLVGHENAVYFGQQ